MKRNDFNTAVFGGTAAAAAALHDAPSSPSFSLQAVLVPKWVREEQIIKAAAPISTKHALNH